MYNGSVMTNAKHSEEFGKAFRDLLAKYNMTLRAAEMKGNYVVSFSYLSDWVRGRLPQYQKLRAFLEYWPMEDRLGLMSAAGYPPPTEWGQGGGVGNGKVDDLNKREEDILNDVPRIVTVAMNGAKDISPETRQRIMASVERELQKAREKFGPRKD
ncbi:MAG TPA: hypothetical protein VGK34_00050 [Armatimonadota bacterium]